MWTATIFLKPILFYVKKNYPDISFGNDGFGIEGEKFCLHSVLVNNHQGWLVYTNNLLKPLLIL